MTFKLFSPDTYLSIDNKCNARIYRQIVNQLLTFFLETGVIKHRATVPIPKVQYELGASTANTSTNLYILKGDVFPRTSAVKLELWRKTENGCENCEHSSHRRINVDVQMITDGKHNMY